MGKNIAIKQQMPIVAKNSRLIRNLTALKNLAYPHKHKI
jgi:hypothetical protein